MPQPAIPELVKRNNSIIFNGEILEIYIPKQSLKGDLAEYNGEYIHAMGIFLFEIKSFADEEKDKSGTFYTMKYPAFIDFQYSDSHTYKGEIEGYSSDEYEVFRLENGNQFIANTILPKSNENAVKYIEALHKGHLPKILSYDDILQLYLEAMEISGINLNASSLIFEMIISEASRSKANINDPFRFYINRAIKGTKYDYEGVNINTLPMRNSTFAGLTFQDINLAMATSIDRTQQGDREQPTPLEKAARY